MGLDQYAYAAAKAGQYDEFYKSGEWDSETQEYVSTTCSKPAEIAYWRKHPNLQGWMEELWHRKLADQGSSPEESDWGSSFNGVELELTWDDLADLEQAILNGTLPETSGFFFGNDSSEHYRNEDLAFITEARANIFLGFKVFYNSSW